MEFSAGTGDIDTPYLAVVRWWDCKTITVVCPMCSKMEEYDAEFCNGVKLIESRLFTVSCRSWPFYFRAIFPWEGRQLGLNLTYQKNWERHRFETVGLEQPIDLIDMKNLQSRRTESTIQILGRNAVGREKVLMELQNGNGSKNRTVAILHRGDLHPLVVAVSGWGDSISGSELLISQGIWTKEVQKISEDINHYLEIHPFDRECHDGKISACHAEKQLMVCFIRSHCHLLPGGSTGGDGLEGLQDLQPKQQKPVATIAIDQPQCDNCRLFQKILEAIYQIKFKIELMDENFRRGKGVVTPSRKGPRRQQLLTPFELDIQQRGDGEWEEDGTAAAVSTPVRRSARVHVLMTPPNSSRTETTMNDGNGAFSQSPSYGKVKGSPRQRLEVQIQVRDDIRRQIEFANKKQHTRIEVQIPSTGSLRDDCNMTAPFPQTPTRKKRVVELRLADDEFRLPVKQSRKAVENHQAEEPVSPCEELRHSKERRSTPLPQTPPRKKRVVELGYADDEFELPVKQSRKVCERSFDCKISLTIRETNY